jgi:N-acetyl-anhydromuramyl-L-alanine amidase AmpD
MENRTVTNRIVIHHSASPTSTTIEQVDQWHRNQGFAMVGYHYFIEQDGEVKKGRPDWAVGAHALSANKDSIGICLAGDFTDSLPTSEQIESIVSLIERLRKLYGEIPVVRHSDVDATACPGAMFPWEDLISQVDKKEGVIVNIDEAMEVLKEKGIISAAEYWKSAAQCVRYLDNLLISVANYIK